MKCGLLMDIVVAQSTSVFQLLSCEDKTLLIGWDALLVLDLGLDVLDRIRGLNLKGNGLASEGLDKDLHASSEPEYQMKCGLLLDVVVAQSASVFQLLPGEDKTLLIGRDALLVLYFSFHVFD